MSSRLIAGVVMGSLGVFLIGLLAPALPVEIAFAALVILVVAAAPSAAKAWHTLFITNGMLSVTLGAVSLGVAHGTQWPSGWSYERDILRSIGPISLLDVLSHHATELGIAAVVLGAVLLALGYGLVPPHSDRRRHVH